MRATMTAPSSGAVSSALIQEGWVPLSVEHIPQTAWNLDVGAWRKNRPIKLPSEQIALFARQLYQLLQAGVPIARAVASLGEEEVGKFHEMTEDISTKTAGGMPLSQAMSNYPGCFDDVFISYIEAGEQTGTIRDTVNRLAHMLEKRVTLNKKIRSVTAYPKFVSIAIALIVTGILMFMVPMYANIYKSFGAQLPLPTRILVSISHVIVPIHFLHTFGLNMFGVRVGPNIPSISLFGHSMPFPPIPFPNPLSPIAWIIVAILAVRYFLDRTKDDPRIGTRVDRIRFRLPLFGQLMAKLSMYRWASTLAGALASGINMQPALDLAAKASGSRWQRAIVGGLKENVRGGRQLSDGLAENRDLFPPNLRSMVSTGEQAGEVDTMLESVATAMDDEIETIISSLAAKIEVALIIVMGAVVGAILIALYLPILHLALVAAHGLSGGSF